MIGAIYGSLPIVHDTGGLHDTVCHLDVDGQSGNGFVFKVHDAGGLRWGIDEAMRFWKHDEDTRTREITRIMNEAAAQFTHTVTARQYIDIYERMLQRPLVQAF